MDCEATICPEWIGKYRVVRRLGSGAMGDVYEVVHPELGRNFALKRFSLKKENSALFRRRFAVEGKLLSRIQHSNVVGVHDMHFDAESGEAYIVLDLVLDDSGEPKTLLDLSFEVVDEDRIAEWFRQLCSAMAAIHKMGIVHRDFKLNNVLVEHTGKVVLSDFGIAKVLDDQLRLKVAASLTMMNTTNGTPRNILGTMAYVAPELERGGEVTTAADVYSLGVAFFRLLVGVWYDPYLTVDFKQLLAGFEYNWWEVIPPLLAAQPQERPNDLNALAGRLRRKERAKPRGLRVSWPVVGVAIAAVVAVAAAILIAGGAWRGEVGEEKAARLVMTERVVTNEVVVAEERVITNEVVVVEEREGEPLPAIFQFTDKEEH